VAQAILPVCLCFAPVLLIVGEQLAISELPSVLSRGLRQHSQEWLCHKDQIRELVAQAFLPVRLSPHESRSCPKLKSHSATRLGAARRARSLE
jgi:hypothetical protein